MRQLRSPSSPALISSAARSYSTTTPLIRLVCASSTCSGPALPSTANALIGPACASSTRSGARAAVQLPAAQRSAVAGADQQWRALVLNDRQRPDRAGVRVVDAQRARAAIHVVVGDQPG